MVIDRDSQNQDALDGIAEVQRQRQESEADREARIASLLEQGASQASAGDLDAGPDYLSVGTGPRQHQ